MVDDRRRSDDLFEPESLSLGHCLRLGHAGYVILQSSATLCIFAVRECGSDRSSELSMTSKRHSGLKKIAVREWKCNHYREPSSWN